MAYTMAYNIHDLIAAIAAIQSAYACFDCRKKRNFLTALSRRERTEHAKHEGRRQGNQPWHSQHVTLQQKHHSKQQQKYSTRWACLASSFHSV